MSATETSLESIAQERQRIQDEILRLQEQDRQLYRQQVQLQTKTTILEEREETDSEAASPIKELEPAENPFWGSDKVALVSYPRSGNSLLRRVVENLSGTVTGSDARPDRKLVKQLTAMGMRGEGVMDMRVWCVKTHYPERVGRARLPVTRAILIIRNPFDSIASFFQMMLTDSHTKSVSAEEVNSRFAELWKDFLVEELSIWMQFHAHWRQAKSSVLVIRYEDLVQHRAKTIEKVADFLYAPFIESEVITEKEVRSKIDSLTRLSHKDVTLYAPKAFNTGKSTDSQQETSNASSSTTTSGATAPSLSSIPVWDPIDPDKPGYLKSMSYFSNEQYRYVLAAARSELVRYGYWDGCVAARVQFAPDLVPYVDIDPGGCIINDEGNKLRLNSRFALRPRTKKDPYGRGFDVRWEDRLNALPKPIVSTDDSRN